MRGIVVRIARRFPTELALAELRIEGSLHGARGVEEQHHLGEGILCVGLEGAEGDDEGQKTPKPGRQRTHSWHRLRENLPKTAPALS